MVGDAKKLFGFLPRTFCSVPQGYTAMLGEINKVKRMGRRVGITFSAFDLLHAGHCAMLAECKNSCEFLIVGLQTDPTIDRPDTKNKPVQSVFERWVQLQAIEEVDLIIPYATEDEIIDLLHIIRPDVRFLGEEYKDKEFTGWELDIPIKFNSRRHSFSTTDLRRRIAENK